MTNDLQKAIHAAINDEFNRLIEQEVAAAKDRLAIRIGEHLAKTAMTVSKFYDLTAQHDQIVIRVRKEFKP